MEGKSVLGTGELMNNFGTALNVFYLILTGYFFSVYFLYKFGYNAKKGLENSDA
ncbi:hypothetical protein [Flavobacterium hungaricum]|uniref:hypothetical protein n=1 Tax=Flavobacterium hungaricum TaxID=2082725 RepID=UPI0018840210|nr:hypothetical protein [Flavobacterium hungaricum]